MKITMRRALLNLLGIIIFLMITVVALIISRGNRFDTQGLQFVETGSIRLTVEPTDAQILLNNKSASLNEKRIEGLDPGVYQISVRKDGYTAWDETVEVASGIITDLSLKLFPLNQKIVKTTTTNIDNVVFTKARNNLIYIVQANSKGSEVGIWKQNLREEVFPINNQGQRTKIANIPNEESFKQSMKVIASPGAERILLADNNFQVAYILDGGRLNEFSAANKINLDLPIGSVEFIDSNTLLIEHNNLLAEYNINSQTTTLLFYQEKIKPIYAVNDNTLFWLSANGKKLWSRSGGQTLEVKVENKTLPENIVSIHPTAGGKNIIFKHSDNRITFLDIPTSYIKTFDGRNLISVSPNGQYIIANSVNNKVVAIENTIIQINNDISHREFAVNTTVDELNNIVWSFSSNFFIAQGKDGKLTSYGSRANNANVLFANEDSRLVEHTYSISSDNNQLVMLVKDGAENSSQSNIYYLPLK